MGPSESRMTNPFWNRDERRVRAFWRIFAQLSLRILFLIGLVQLLRSSAVALGVSSGEAQGWRSFLREFHPELPTSSALVQGVEMVASIASAVVATRWLDRRPFASLGFSVRRSAWWHDLAFGFGAGLVAIASIVGCEMALGRVHLGGGANPFASPYPLIAWLVFGLVGCVFNGVEEEISDGRAYLIRNAAEGLAGGRVSPQVALIIALLIGSTLFGLAHFPGGGASLALGTGVVGVMFGLSYVLTGEIAIAIGLHTAWNFAQINLVNLSEDPARPIPPVLTLSATNSPVDIERSGSILVGIFIGVILTLAWVSVTRGSLRLPVERFGASSPRREPTR